MQRSRTTNYSISDEKFPGRVEKNEHVEPNRLPVEVIIVLAALSGFYRKYSTSIKIKIAHDSPKVS